MERRPGGDSCAKSTIELEHRNLSEGDTELTIIRAPPGNHLVLSIMIDRIVVDGMRGFTERYGVCTEQNEPLGC
ncbi:unnamed protein product [Haemonchus placei]|uniref:Uncharacterized protein n=1 Tax=Haemonchus placei TaxID=6290 RepID=A0A3P7VGH8_HAEPC|nr:unnamed protein product [Haemonchus placei]